MKITAVVLCTATLFLSAAAEHSQAIGNTSQTSPQEPVSNHASDASSLKTSQTVVEESCRSCHSNMLHFGNLSLDSFDVAAAEENAEVAEKMIRKLRAGMMPPAGVPRPSENHLTTLATELETQLDEAAATSPNPGRRTFQRLNRSEYENSIHDLLALDINAGDYLPLDTKSANFDNIADVQMLSPTLMEGYLRAASEISRLAVGDPNATSPKETTYKVTRWASQTEQVDDAPYGTRGGVSVVHNFPADGQYHFRVSFHHETTGALHGSGSAALHTAEVEEQIEISVNGERVALLDIDRWMHVSDPDGVNIRTGPVSIQAGPQHMSAAFIKRFEGPFQDLISPHDWSIASTSIASAYGFTSLPHLRDLAIRGPYNITGVSKTPSRQRIFTCLPETPDKTAVCAEAIVSRLGTRAYRRPLSAENLEALMSLYQVGAEDSFESGIQMALEGILASPHFVFRFEEPPVRAETAAAEYRVGDLDLASRLSFFLWGTGPDDKLLKVARDGNFSDPEMLELQARRMLADPRSEALSTLFAAQWLRLQDMDKLHPNVRTYPDFHEQLKNSMRRETELFFSSLVREDRNVLELLTADYTFLDERLAKHYGIRGVFRNDFRRVPYPNPRRRGLLGHGSILMLTSHASRTSPVLRGKWIMEVLLGSPPPPPPPNVPELEEAGEAEGGRFLSVREQMEKHRSNPACNSCHRVIDPLGLALENFDATGAWRIKDKGVPIDASGELYDSTPLNGPEDLRQALLKRSTSLVRTFTENLMAYALGRRIKYYDMPAIRKIEREAAASGNRLSSFILGVIHSAAFQKKAGLVAEVAQTNLQPARRAKSLVKSKVEPHMKPHK